MEHGRWLLVLLIIALAAGCSRATPIPDSAQVVRVVITASDVRLDPAIVRPGEVYLVLEAPAEGSFAFVERKSAADASPGPLSKDDLARLMRGDTQGTAISGLDAGGCSAEQNAQDRGQLGPCGNVMMVVVIEGIYAIVGGSPEGDPLTGRPPPLAVLEVSP